MKGHTIVIIGGSSGIGLATAHLASKSGAKLIIAGRSVDKLQAVQKELDCTVHQLDNRTPKAVEAFFDKIECFDHLFAPAASYVRGPITSSLEVARSCFDNKFWPQYWAVKYAHPKIQKSIVLMSGAFSQRPPNDGASYAACNGAIECLAKALAVELSPIRVNAVAPGAIRTPFVWEGSTENAREKVYKEYSELCLLRKVGEPEDVAQAVLYLMNNHYTTGSTLYPDGGYVLR